MVERIRTLLESRQLTPTQFADLIGVARPIISHILSGRNKPSLEVVQRILAAMPDLSMAWLLNGSEPMLTTIREPAPEMLVPNTPEGVAAPAGSSSSPPVAVAHIPTPKGSLHLAVDADSSVNQGDKAQKAVSDKELISGDLPMMPKTPVVAQPVRSTASRLPMPRRFSVKPPMGGQLAPVSLVGSATPSTPVLPAPEDEPAPVVGGVPLAVAPTAVASASIRTENIEEKGSVAPPAVSGEPFTTATRAEAAIPGAVAPASVSSALGIPQVGMPPPAPVPMASSAPIAAPTLANDMATALFTGAEKPIRRIVIFYRDGSFADYQPE